jgi:hypothetical protein
MGVFACRKEAAGSLVLRSRRATRSLETTLAPHGQSDREQAAVPTFDFRPVSQIFLGGLVSDSNCALPGPETPPSLFARSPPPDTAAMSGHGNAVPDVSQEQGLGVHDRATQEGEAHVVARHHTEPGAKRPFRLEQGRRLRHPGTHPHRPKASWSSGRRYPVNERSVIDARGTEPAHQLSSRGFL